MTGDCTTGRPRVRVGTDVQAIDEVAASIERYGARYLDRIFTPHEVESTGGPGAIAAPGLAARFAAKEAVIKLLRPDNRHVPGWRTIEVRRHEDGWCDVRLSGDAELLASRAGIRDLSLSLSHDAGVATATVVGMCEP